MLPLPRNTDDAIRPSAPTKLRSLSRTASPASGSIFKAWGGDCAALATSGGGNLPTIGFPVIFDATGSVIVSYPESCTATFELGGVLTLTTSGTGTGTTSSVPAGINCSSGTCSALFDEGAQVTLTATPASGSTFTGWGGACAPAGTNAIAQLTVTGDESCTATFENSNPSVFVGSWDWTDTASDGSSYPGTMTISQVAVNGSYAWTWIAGYSGTGTSAGSTLTLNGATAGLTAHWVGVLDPTGKRIDGTWTQSDGQVGTFKATR